MSQEPEPSASAQGNSLSVIPEQTRFRVDLSNKVTFINPQKASQYRCGICHETAVEATALCGSHIFCHSCAQLHEQHNARPNANDIRVVLCPICRQETACILIKRMDFIDRQIRQLLVKCPNHELTRQRVLGLQWKDPRSPHSDRIIEHQRGPNSPPSRGSSDRLPGKIPERHSVQAVSRDVSRHRMNHNSRAPYNRWRPTRRSIEIIARSRSTPLPRNRSRSRSRERRANSESGNVTDAISKRFKSLKSTRSTPSVSSSLTPITPSCTPCPSVASDPSGSPLELCQWVGPYEELQSHIDQCPLHTIQCEHCFALMFRRDVEGHIAVCTGRAPCDKCGDIVVKGEKERHLDVCRELEIQCKYKEYGCEDRFKRKDEEGHMTEKMKDHLDLVSESNKELNASFTKFKDKTSRKMRRIKDRHRKYYDELADRIHKLEVKMDLDSSESEDGDEGNEQIGHEGAREEEEQVDWGEIEYGGGSSSDDTAVSNSDQSVY